jgi:hypothetical protein
MSLFSATGQTRYRSIGYLSKKQILSIVDDYIRDRENGSDSGKIAGWMRNA